MRARSQDQALKRARAHLKDICAREEKREDAAATYSLIATRLLALALKLQPGGPRGMAARSFLHGVFIQLQDDLLSVGIDPEVVLLRPGMTG
jgi:hypothetical protein